MSHLFRRQGSLPRRAGAKHQEVRALLQRLLHERLRAGRGVVGHGPGPRVGERLRHVEQQKLAPHRAIPDEAEHVPERQPGGFVVEVRIAGQDGQLALVRRQGVGAEVDHERLVGRLVAAEVAQLSDETVLLLAGEGVGLWPAAAAQGFAVLGRPLVRRDARVGVLVDGEGGEVRSGDGAGIQHPGDDGPGQGQHDGQEDQDGAQPAAWTPTGRRMIPAPLPRARPRPSRRRGLARRRRAVGGDVAVGRRLFGGRRGGVGHGTVSRFLE